MFVGDSHVRGCASELMKWWVLENQTHECWCW
jgi:hypothetical protein